MSKIIVAKEINSKLVILENLEVNYGKKMYDLNEVIGYLINY